jgi:hypothetical protein
MPAGARVHSRLSVDDIIERGSLPYKTLNSLLIDAEAKQTAYIPSDIVTAKLVSTRFVADFFIRLSNTMRDKVYDIRYGTRAYDRLLPSEDKCLTNLYANHFMYHGIVSFADFKYLLFTYS